MKMVTLTPSELRAKLIESGVTGVREFGYPACTAENILTDYVYAKVFLSRLNDLLADTKLMRIPGVCRVITQLQVEASSVKWTK